MKVQRPSSTLHWEKFHAVMQRRSPPWFCPETAAETVSLAVELVDERIEDEYSTEKTILMSSGRGRKWKIKILERE